MHLTLQAAYPVDEDHEAAAAPEITLPRAVRWTERTDGWELNISGRPSDVAALLSAVPFKHENLALGEFDTGNGMLIEVDGSPDEWDEFLSVYRQDGSREDVEIDLEVESDLMIVWHFPHDDLSIVDEIAVEMDDCRVHLSPEARSIVVSMGVDQDDVDDVLDAGYDIAPIDDEQEEFRYGGSLMGHLVKDRDSFESEDGSPFLTLHGMATTNGNRHLAAPFPQVIHDVNIPELRRIIENTIDVGEHDHDIEYDDEMTVEWNGISVEDNEAMFALPMLFLYAAMMEADDLSDEEKAASTMLLVGSMLSGSRIARAELARRGYDTDLAEALGPKNCTIVINAVLLASAQLEDVMGDRAARIWSLPRRAAVNAESLLEEWLDSQEEETPVELINMTCAFDVGVRYQMARVIPRGDDIE